MLLALLLGARDATKDATFGAPGRTTSNKKLRTGLLASVGGPFGFSFSFSSDAPPGSGPNTLQLNPGDFAKGLCQGEISGEIFVPWWHAGLHIL